METQKSSLTGLTLGALGVVYGDIGTSVLYAIKEIFSAGLFYGDGIITPAISVLSAVEGLAVLSPQLSSAVVPLTLAI